MLISKYREEYENTFVSKTSNFVCMQLDQMHNELHAQKYGTKNYYKQDKITKCITCEKRELNEKMQDSKV